jgi:hypothetical protein
VGIGLTLAEENVDHRFFMSVKSIVAYGVSRPSGWPTPWGPDMQLLKLPPDRARELKKGKQFYRLTAQMPDFPNVNSLELWVLMGHPPPWVNSNRNMRTLL